MCSSFDDSRQIQQLNVGSFVLERKHKDRKLKASCRAPERPQKPRACARVQSLQRMGLSQPQDSSAQSPGLWFVEATSRVFPRMLRSTLCTVRPRPPKASHGCSWTKHQGKSPTVPLSRASEMEKKAQPLRGLMRKHSHHLAPRQIRAAGNGGGCHSPGLRGHRLSSCCCSQGLSKGFSDWLRLDELQHSGSFEHPQRDFHYLTLLPILTQIFSLRC